MIVSVDPYFARTFHRETYNCLHFARDVWRDATGEDLDTRLHGLRRRLKRIERPTDPCLVLMQRPNSQPHVGIFIRRSVLHITELGVEFQPVDVASRGFKTVRYYA